MKFSERWMREWVDPAVDTAGLVAQLTAAGLEVDATTPAGPELDLVVVGRVLAAARHPDADALSVCTVDVGGESPLHIVCGAPNARSGLLAPVATVGARLPGGLTIKRSRIRGQISEGMLCSARELGLGDDASGLLELDAENAPGMPIARALALDDTCIDVDLTPNRGDCLYVEGIARDVAAINGTRLQHLVVEAVPAACDTSFDVRLDAPRACPRYVGRVIQGVNVRARTPNWMVERLRRSGVRSLGPVVDVTNYVMLELGHPMHAFDLDRLRGGVVVRHAAAGERVVLLDDSEHTLDNSDLVIADAQGAVALAGIMGGRDSAVSDDTSRVFLECAWFEPRGIAASARRLGLHTDASHRFERHVNPDGQVRAAQRATALLLAIVGGEAGPLVDTVVPEHLPRPSSVRLRGERIRRLLGVDVPAAEVHRVLDSLHMQVEAVEGGWSVTPPPFRPDIAIEADLVEEVARVRGFDSIPDAAPVAALHVQAQPESRRSLRTLRRTLVARGYQEAVTYSFVDPVMQAAMEHEVTPVALSNPISSDLAVMRTSLMPGLLHAALYNFKRQQPRVRLFESGLVFRATAGQMQQPARLGAIALGPAAALQWGLDAREVDFHDVKADVEALFGVNSDALVFEPATHPALHPGQCAAIRLQEQAVGIIGRLHPSLARRYKLPVAVVLFELELAAVLQAPVPGLRAFSRQPVVRRDLALVVDEAVSASAVIDCVGQAGGDMLQNLELFDLYRGEGIDSGRKSLALSLTFQAPSRTLDEAEVEVSVANILASLSRHLGATLRG